MGFLTPPFKQSFLSGMAFSIYVENDITNAKSQNWKKSLLVCFH